MNIEGEAPGQPEKLETVDNWLLSRLAETEEIVRKAYDAYDIQSATQALYRFFWSELCDWYIEVSKSRLQDEATRSTPQWVLLTAIEAFLKMIHPVMPHISEELYSHLPIAGKAPFLMVSPWPEGLGAYRDKEAEAKVERWFEITRTLRALRAELELSPIKQIPVAYFEGDLAGGDAVISGQAWVQELKSGAPAEPHISTTVEGVDLHLPFAEGFDVKEKANRLRKEQADLQGQLEKIDGRLNNPQFVERAKPEAVERDREAAADLRSRLEKIQQRLKIFG